MLKPEDRHLAHRLMLPIQKAAGEWGKQEMLAMCLGGQDEKTVNDVATMIILVHDRYIEFEPVSEKFALTDKGEDFMDNYDPASDCLHEWTEDETGAEPPFDVCTNCGETRY
jgi:hypothetical protein